MRNGERRGPVKKGDATACESTRSLRIVPGPPHLPSMQPVIYDGAKLLRFCNWPLGSAAGRGIIGSGSKPARTPVITLPGLSYLGRPPRFAAQLSHSHAVIEPFASRPAR